MRIHCRRIPCRSDPSLSLCGGIVVIAMFAACEKSPTRPAPPPLNGTPVVGRLEVSGPDTIAPGARELQAVGETQISASIFPNVSMKSVAVMPAGTFKLVGNMRHLPIVPSEPELGRCSGSISLTFAK